MTNNHCIDWLPSPLQIIKNEIELKFKTFGYEKPIFDELFITKNFLVYCILSIHLYRLFFVLAVSSADITFF